MKMEFDVNLGLRSKETKQQDGQRSNRTSSRRHQVNLNFEPNSFLCCGLISHGANLQGSQMERLLRRAATGTAVFTHRLRLPAWG